MVLRHVSDGPGSPCCAQAVRVGTMQSRSESEIWTTHGCCAEHEPETCVSSADTQGRNTTDGSGGYVAAKDQGTFLSAYGFPLPLHSGFTRGYVGY